MRHMRLARVSARRRMIFRADRTKMLHVKPFGAIHGLRKCTFARCSEVRRGEMDQAKYCDSVYAFARATFDKRHFGREEFLSDNPYFITLIDSDMPPASIFSKGRGFWQY